mgnify:FL=1
MVGMGDSMKHVSDILPDKGLLVLVATHDLIENVNSISCITNRVGSKSVYALTGLPAFRAETYRMSIIWVKMIGHTDNILFCRHELSVLLGIDAGRGQVRNGIVIVKDGKIVWSKVADARRPNAPHEIDAFVEAFDYHDR